MQSKKPTISIDRAAIADLPTILDLLAQSDLPDEGLEAHLSTTLVVRVGPEVVGSAALELYEPAALLRSVAVKQGLRGRGLGHQLVQGVLALAWKHGITHVYLLTETAEDFFPRFGFRPIIRSRVPTTVQGSLEFTSLCPESSVAMEAELSEVE